MTRNGNGSSVDLWITRCIKACGALIAVHEAVTTRDAATFAIASFMLAGAQGAENIIRKDKS
jgi:hypothetical protein